MRYLIILAVFTLSGCGQKGALFLPQDKPHTLPAEQQSQSKADTSTTQGQPQG
ncbi:MAG: putative small lipoprotein YifL [Bermanella sp.]|jgi:predicted small lipoprotein YifL